MSRARVLIVDDEELIRQGLRILVNSDERTTVVGVAVDGDEALAQTIGLQPDVVLMDIQMPGMNGIEATRRITDEHPGVNVLALTTFSSQHHVVSALRAGASGYLVKDTAPEDLVQAIVDIWRSAPSQQISRELVAAVRAPETPTARLEVVSDLTEREFEIVQLLAQGKSNAEIGTQLHIDIAETTVKANFGRIMAKWNARDRVQVLVHAAKSGLVALE